MGSAAQPILDRATRLDPFELRQLERGYRHLDRFWSGGLEERLLDVGAGVSGILQPGTGGDLVPRSESWERLRAEVDLATIRTDVVTAVNAAVRPSGAGLGLATR